MRAARLKAIAARLDAYERLVRLDKPIGILLLLWPTLSALWLAARGTPAWSLVLIFTMGTILTRSAGCAVNDWADRRFDPHVARTASRPLASGELPQWEALAVGAVLGLCAFVFVLATNKTAILLSFPAAAIAIAYPFFKRFFFLPQGFLGIAFSFGIPMAYAAVYDRRAADRLVAAGRERVLGNRLRHRIRDGRSRRRRAARPAHLRDRIRALRRCRGRLLLRDLPRGDGGRRSRAADGALRITPELRWRSLAPRITSGSFATATAIGALPRSSTITGSGFVVFAGIALDYAVRLHAWPRAL